MNKFNCLMAFVFLLLPIAAGSQELSEREKTILDMVARERGLTKEQTILLYSIRSHENGAPGMECGVVQPCARYYRDGFMSLIVQADFASWIINQRFNGSIDKFSHVYHNGDAKSDAHWRDCVRIYYRKYLQEIRRENEKKAIKNHVDSLTWFRTHQPGGDMETRINGRNCSGKQFAFELEKMGFGGIDLTITKEAKSKIMNSYTAELKTQLLEAFESFPSPAHIVYLRAFDLLMAALDNMRQNYEDFEYAELAPDERQGTLFGRRFAA